MRMNARIEELLKQDEAIEFVMQFYNISRETAVVFFWNEVESYMELMDERTNQEAVAAAVAAEREACAKAAENEWNFDSTECGIDVANDIAAAIRARGGK